MVALPYVPDVTPVAVKLITAFELLPVPPVTAVSYTHLTLPTICSV